MKGQLNLITKNMESLSILNNTSFRVNRKPMSNFVNTPFKTQTVSQGITEVPKLNLTVHQQVQKKNMGF